MVDPMVPLFELKKTLSNIFSLENWDYMDLVMENFKNVLNEQERCFN